MIELGCAETYFQNLPGSPTFSPMSLNGSLFFVLPRYEWMCYSLSLSANGHNSSLLSSHAMCFMFTVWQSAMGIFDVSGNVNADRLLRHSDTWCTDMVERLGTLVKNTYVMAFDSSSNFFSSHFSVMEWVEHVLLCRRKNIHEVGFKSEFIKHLVANVLKY